LISAKKPMSSSQDSRKDPRSKILNLTVRYKSATVAEFVEDYSYDISRGGLFIKTNSPFPTGTLLKFEVRIGEEQTVIDGVGRVTWRRERNLGPGKPAGMGIKFIRIADDCVQVIQNAVDKHADDGGQFEEGAREQGVTLSEPPVNLRSSATASEASRASEPAPVPRMFPKASQPSPGSELDDPSDQSMLFQSTELLKAAMSKVTPGEQGEEHPHVEDRVTLPTGASRIPPAAASAVAATAAVTAASAAAAVKTDPPKAAATDKVAANETAESGPVPAPDDDGPDSSDEVTREFIPAEHGLAIGIPGQTSRSKPPSSRRKNPKKKKKKFNYTSLPAPKQSKPPSAIEAKSETSVTSPPKAQSLPPPPPAKGGVPPWAVGLGILAVLGGVFLFLNSRNEKKPPVVAPTIAAEPAPAPVVTANEVPAATAAVVPDTAAVAATASVAAASSSSTTTEVTSTVAATTGSPAAEPVAAEAAKAEEAVEEAAPAEEKAVVESATARAARLRAARRRAKKAAEEEAAAAPAPQPAPAAAPAGDGLPAPSPANAPGGAVSPAPAPSPTPAPSPSPSPAPAPAPTPSPAPTPAPAPTPPTPAPPAPIPPAPAPPAPAPPPPAPPSPSPPTPAQ
jgi:uncharacterized protein (TIGR02266 family)